MTIKRFNEIRDTLYACKTIKMVNTYAISVGDEVSEAPDDLKAIIHNLAGHKRREIRRGSQ